MLRPRIKEVLIRYEMPLVCVAQTDDSHRFVCLNVEESEDCQDKFLVTSVRERDLRRFIDEEVDLRYLLRQRNSKQYTCISTGEVNEQLELKRYKGSIEEYLPEPALFLRGYEGPLRAKDSGHAPITRRKVLIDGHWGLVDMRRFSNVFGDAYAFLFSLQGGSGVNVSRVKTLFEKYPWRGGFSAVNFYEELALVVPFRYRPTVAEMVKQSPGFIDLCVHKNTSQQIIKLVEQISDTKSVQNATYSEVRGKLRERKWLGRSAAEVKLKQSEIDFLHEQIEVMASALHLHNRIQFINELASNDPLAAVKILLSVYRRVRELADYLDTGKAQFAELTNA